MCPLEPPRIFPQNEINDFMLSAVEFVLKPAGDLARQARRVDHDHLTCVWSRAHADVETQSRVEEVEEALGRGQGLGGGHGSHGVPSEPVSAALQFAMIVFSDSCSALLTASQRAQASGSISSTMASSTQSRRSFGSIASSSQHWSPKVSMNQW